MSISKQITTSFLASLNTRSLLKRLSPVIVHPFYHTVSDAYLPHINPLYTPRFVQDFRKDLDFLCTYFKPISIEQVWDYYTNPQSLQENCFHLSFDDGLREVYTEVAPILAERNIPATLFVNPSFIDNKHLFYRHKQAVLIDRLSKENRGEEAGKVQSIPFQDREQFDCIASEIGVDFRDYLQTQKPYMAREELLELQEKGFSIAAHSMNHFPFLHLEENEQIRQVLDSCRFIREHFPNSQNFFSFPFSDKGLNDSLFLRLFESDVRLTFGIAGIGTRFDGRHIARIVMEQKNQSARATVNRSLLKSILK